MIYLYADGRVYVCRHILYIYIYIYIYINLELLEDLISGGVRM